MGDLRLILWLMRCEMRTGLRGFRVFVACLALGVTAIAGVGSIGASVTAGLEANSQTLLGGDMDLRLLHRDFSAEHQAWLQAESVGISKIIKLRAMARPVENNDKRNLIELKGVDKAYPLFGRFVSSATAPLRELLRQRDGTWGAVADANLLVRLGLAVGDQVGVGTAVFTVRATVVTEPDRAASLFSFGPRFLVSKDALAATGLIQPGSQISYHTRVVLADGVDPADWRSRLAATFPKAGWRVRGLNNAAPGVQQFIDRMTLFLSFVGLTVLLVGGLGVANTVSSYLDTKTRTIATLKCVGAPGRMVFRLYMAQILGIATIGICIGLLVGSGGAYAFAVFSIGRMPVIPVPGCYGEPLIVAGVFGLLVAVTFALWPIARAREVPAATLFRDAVAPITTWPRRAYILATLVGLILLAAFTILSAIDRGFATWFVLSAAATMVLLRGGAWVVMAVAKRAPAFGSPAFRLALTNLWRPGGATTSIMLSLGCGLAVLVTVGLIQGNLARQIAERLPDRAPAFFFMDIQPHQVEPFDKAVNGVAGTGNYQRVPTLRGRIVKIAGVPVANRMIAENARWAVRGDRVLTYMSEKPETAEIIAGSWWSEDYRGPPAISLDAGLARGFGVSVGDTLSFNILGREITTTINSLREINWRSLRFDFAVIFAPGTLESAPQTHIAAIEAPVAAEDAVEKAATDAFPNISAIRVRDALAAAANLVAGIGAAVTGMASITILVGALVLSAAVAANRRRQQYDAVVFKVLGATRRRLLGVFLMEYGVLGAATALVGAVVGSAAAWAIVTFLMKISWVFLPKTVAIIALGCLFIALSVGFVGTWRVLGEKAAPHLRNQ